LSKSIITAGSSRRAAKKELEDDWAFKKCKKKNPVLSLGFLWFMPLKHF
jgi:hypothetical protein